MSCFTSDNASEDWVVLFYDWIQAFMISFKPYFTLLKRGMYTDSDLLNLVGALCISLHLWKKVSKEVGSLSSRKEWQEGKSTMPWFWGIFVF